MFSLLLKHWKVLRNMPHSLNVSDVHSGLASNGLHEQTELPCFIHQEDMTWNLAAIFKDSDHS